MNERIRELKNQTLDKHFSYTWSKMDYYDVTKFAEKFAELIVRECSAIADEPTSQPFQSYGEKIKQHFGVRE